MKNKKCLLSLILALCLCMALAAPAWASDEQEANQTKIIDVENELREYLAEYHPDMVFGSQEFIEYAVNVLTSIEYGDKVLATLDNYDNIRYYLGEYLYNLGQTQTPVETYTSDVIFELPDEYKLQSINNIKANVELKLKEELQHYAEQAISPLRINYNAQAAANYATKYSINYNLDQWNTYPSDCTNFASQALCAGGVQIVEPNPLPQGVMDTIQYWYNRKVSSPVFTPRSSSSWIRVPDLYGFCVYNAGALGISCTSRNDLQQRAIIGDIVQLGNSSGDWYHTIIITSGTKGNYNYCGHTSNRDNHPVSDIPDTNKFRIIRFN